MTGVPRVSVVIPCYLQAEYLPEAIETSLAQTSLPVEVIVVDDGSPDNTSAVAGRYPSVRVLRQTNQGLTGARNTGLAAARGEFVIFLDADDRLVDGAAQAGAAALSAAPGAIMAAGSCRLIDAHGSLMPHLGSGPCPGGDHYELLLRDNHIWPPAVVIFRRELLAQTGGWAAGRRRAEDLELYLRLALTFPIICHPATVAEYRQQPKGLSKDRGSMLAAMAAILREQRPVVELRPEYRDAYAEAKWRWPVHFGESLANEVLADLSHGRWRAAREGFKNLLHYYPTGTRSVFLQGARRLITGRRRPAS